MTATMIPYRCTWCGNVYTMTAPEWQAHYIENGRTHRGPARYSNDPSRPAELAPAVAEPARPKASFGRVILTPIIVVVALGLWLGLSGIAMGAVVGIGYILWASTR